MSCRLVIIRFVFPLDVGCYSGLSVTVFLLLRALRTCNTKILPRGYTTFVRPIVESFTCAYNPISRQEIDELERAQKQFTRAVFWRMTRADPLRAETIPTYAKRCEQLQLETLERRRQRYDVLPAYRHLHKEPPLHKPLARTRVRRASYRYRVSTLINASVPLTLFHCKSYDAFKSAFRSFDVSTLPSYHGLV